MVSQEAILLTIFIERDNVPTAFPVSASKKLAHCGPHLITYQFKVDFPG
jgi:hypothetical protein